MVSSVLRIAARPPSTRSHTSSRKLIFSAGSSGRDGTSSGRIPARSARSVAWAERFDDRTDANVAPARTSVPNAVANDEIVVQSVTRAILRAGEQDSGGGV